MTASPARKPYPPPAPDGRELCGCFLSRQAARRITQVYERHMAPLGITVGQFSLLGMVRVLREAGIGELAEALDLDRTTLTRNLRGLLRAGLAEVEPSAGDRRVRAVRLTAAGKAAWAAGLPRWRAAQDELAARLGGAEALANLQSAWSAAIAALPGIPTRAG